MLIASFNHQNNGEIGQHTMAASMGSGLHRIKPLLGSTDLL
jgi:hypothetical protein